MNHMKAVARTLALSSIALCAIVTTGAQTPTSKAQAYPRPASWAGSNEMLRHYFVYWGYPRYEAHPRYLGVLRGSWREIGVQYGQRAGDLIRRVFEGWFAEKVQVQGSTGAVLDYVHQEERYYQALVPEALAAMQGMAEGAGPELDKSAYAAAMSHYEKILVINSYFGLGVPGGVDTKTGAAPGRALQRGGRVGIPGQAGDGELGGCSGAVILAKGTADGKVIHVSSEDQHFFPQEYLVTYVVRPADPNAHPYTVTDSAGEIGSEHAINDRGVVVSGYAGGSVDIGARRSGLDWQVGVWYATAFASDAKQAVSLLTVGRPAYREKSGNKIVIGKCARGANWLVSDTSEAYVVESIPADLNGVARYAVRRPGDAGEAGDYLVTTNNVEAPDSYDERNVHDTNHAMRSHGSAFRAPAYGLGVNGGNGTRFMTLMTLIKRNYGKITPEMVKGWRTAHYVYDVNGIRHDRLDVPGVGSVSPHLIPGVSTLCAHTSGPAGVDTYLGVNTYVSLSVAQDLTVWRTVGRPCEWKGPWDAISFRSSGAAAPAVAGSARD